MSTGKDTSQQLRVAQIWLNEVTEALSLPRELPHDNFNELLDLTAEIAALRCRPAGPVSTFLLGVAVGREYEAPVSHSAVSIQNVLEKKLTEIKNLLE